MDAVWSIEGALTALGAWCVVSLGFALLVARWIRAAQQPAPGDDERRVRSSGIVTRVDPNSPGWREVTEAYDREMAEREAAAGQSEGEAGSKEGASDRLPRIAG